MIRIESVDPCDAVRVAHLTPPALRPALANPSGKDLAIALARDADSTLGMAYGWGLPAQRSFELVSVYVTPLLRRHGIGSRLLQRVEVHFRARGYRLGIAHYTDPDAEPNLGPFLRANGWSEPVVRQYLFKGDLEGFCNSVWARTRRPRRFQIKPWVQLTEAERASIRSRSARDPGWHAPDQDPFVFEQGCEPDVSIAMLRGQEVVGWVLAHLPPGAECLRWTVSFVAPELARAGHIVHLWKAAALRQRDRTPFRSFTWGVPVSHPRMLRFTRERMRANLLSVARACTSHKLFS